MGNYYGAGACGLTIYDNKYSIYFSSGKYGEIATVDSIRPEIAGLEIENRVKADSISYDNAYIFGAPYSYYRYVRGEIPIHETAFRFYTS